LQPNSRVGRTALLGEKGEALLFLQPVEIDYLHDLQRHGVSLKEYPLEKVLESFPLHGQKQSRKNLVTIEMHPWVLFLQKALESFISAEVCFDFSYSSMFLYFYIIVFDHL